MTIRVPHMRGDEPGIVIAVDTDPGCSPHAWG